MMKKLKITKIIANTLVVTLVLVLNQMGASAEWKDDSTGRWYSEGDSWAIGWRNIDAYMYYFDKDGYMKKGWIQDGGKWYYLNDNGTMAKDKDVSGWYLNGSGVGTECIKVEGFEIDKLTGTIAKFSRSDAVYRPGYIGVPLIIPREIDGIEIKCIGGSAFQYCSNLKSITIPDSVTNINDSAFSDCKGLTSITIPDSVKSIGYDAFSSCDSLTTVIIPDSVTNIGDSVFSSCRSLTSITMPNSIKRVGKWEFYKCDSLTNITIPNGVTSIGQCAFSDCKSLASITIPDSVTSIEETAFSGCSSLKSITIPNSVTSIGDQAFWGCNNAMFYVKSESTKQQLIGNGISTNRIILNAESQTAIK